MTMQAASFKPVGASLNVVRTYQGKSDVSSTSAHDSVIERKERSGMKEDEQDSVSVEIEDRVRAGEETKSLQGKITGEEKEEASKTAEVGLKVKKQRTCPATATGAESSASSPRPFVPLASRSWRAQSTQMTRLMKAALLQTLLHAIRTGSVEGVKVAIERGVQVQYLDSRQRNLVMLASKCDTDARLHIVIILLDAGCDMNHKDQLGWSCLHYACASGATDVAAELIRRGARVEFNPYGYGPEDLNIPKVARARSLLQHTEQLQHEQNVGAAWMYFRRQAEKQNYSIKCNSNCKLGKPLKITFQAPAGHSPLDRIRVVDMNSDVALWLQVSKTFSIPPGDVGTITLDLEALDRPSLYRIIYEKYEPLVAENNLCIKNLDVRTTVPMSSVNNSVLKKLGSSQSLKKLPSLARLASKSNKSASVVRRKSTTQAQEITERERKATVEEDDEDEAGIVADETTTTQEVADLPAVTNITGVYKIVAMEVVNVSALKTAKANKAEKSVRRKSSFGLQLAPKIESLRRSPRLVVQRGLGQKTVVKPGDCPVATEDPNNEHTGLKHKLWALSDAKQPLDFRFRCKKVQEKTRLFKAGLSKLTGPRRQPVVAV